MAQPEKIFQTTFDYFNLGEIPTFILCNPDKTELYALGGISERKYSARFNALSEISFRADEYVNKILMPYYTFLVNRRLVKIIRTDGGGGDISFAYFMITAVSENNDGISKYKTVTCQSLEIELSSKRFVLYMSGSGLEVISGSSGSGTSGSGTSGSGVITILPIPVPVTLEKLLDDLLTYIPGWSRGVVPATIASRYRKFEVTDKTLYDFLMTEIEDSYMCVFDFDTINKVIYIYDPDESITNTDIFISHENVIKSIDITEVTDELATCLNVMGGNNLDIHMVNPLGNNIYNFDYFKSTDWMSQNLLNEIYAWEATYDAVYPTYSSYIDTLYNDYITQGEIQAHIETDSGSLAALEIELGAAYSGSLVDIIADLEAQKAALQAEISYLIDVDLHAINVEIDTTLSTINEMKITVALDNQANFSASGFIGLQPFIIQSSYVNENITIEDGMTTASKIAQSQDLYNQALGVLAKVSEPKYTFNIDTVNFMQIKDFEMFRDQISLGASVTIEIKEGVSTSAILLGMDTNFDDPTDFKLVFGNRLRLNDESYIFKDLMGKALNAGNANKINYQIWNDWNRNFKQNVTNLMNGVQVTAISGSQSMHIDDHSINFMTPNLLWNGIPIGITGGGGGGGGGIVNDITITLFSEGSVKNMYDPTAAGFNEAIRASATGDVIFLPDIDISGNFYIPAGVAITGVSSRETIIRGLIGIKPGCLLENLYIINQQNNTLETDAVIVQEIADNTEPCKIKSCEIYAYQCGIGTTVAVYISGPSITLVVENSTVVSDSFGGLGYTFSNNGGNCNVYHSQYYGKTEVFHDV